MIKRCFLIAGALLLVCGKAHSLTLAEAETEVRRLVKDTATSASLQRYSDTVLDTFLNQAQREVVTQTWCLQKTTTLTLAAGSTWYSLPSDLINVKTARFRDSTGRVRALDQKSYQAIFQTNPDWERQPGPPFSYLLRYSTAAGSYYEVAFIPIPTISSTGTAVMEYYKQATDLTADSDVLLDGFKILIPYHETVIYPVVAKILLLEGDTASATLYLQLYQDAVKNMNSRLGEMPNYSPGLSGATH